MAESFGVDNDYAKDLVQEMYLRLHKYVDNPEKIMYSENEVNTFYVYVTLRNIYLTAKNHSRHFVSFSIVNHAHTEKFDEPPIERKVAFDKIISGIEDEVSEWYWYDKKLWDIHFKKQVSMRQISNDTKISLSSIFNTLKKCKNKIRNLFQEDVDDFKNEDYDRI